MRRFFVGLISGAIVAVVGLGIVSQIASPRAAAIVDDGAVPHSATDIGGVANSTSPDVTASDAMIDEPVVDAAQPDPAIAADVQETDPLATAVPPSSDASASLAPVAADEGVATPPSVEGQAETDAQSATGPEPVNVTQPNVVAADDTTKTALAEVLSPPVAPLTEVPQPQVTAGATVATAAPTAESTSDVAQTGPDAPRAPGADSAPPVADLPPPPPLTLQEQAVLAPVVPLDTVELPSVSAATPATTDPVITAPDADAGTAAEPEIALVTPIPPAAIVPDDAASQAPTAVDTMPSVLQTDTPLIESAPELPVTPSLRTAGEGVIVNRAGTSDPATEAVADSPILPEVNLDDQPPLRRFASAFENADAKPLFSIVLIDTGEATLDRAAIASLPFAVSVAIDPLLPQAAAYAALYRAGGKEVLMLASGIPVGANPADLEQTFQALDAAMPEAVAVVDTEAASFQDDRPLATQIVPILAEQGRGLLTWDRGLNAADQVARREGLASAMIFRRIDGDGETSPVIRRYLDRAAFKAAQEGQVTVVGQARAETVAALLEWTIEGRAATVALAPISAQLAVR